MSLLASLFVETNDFVLQFVQVGALEVVLLVLLLEQVEILLDLLLLRQVKLTLHPREGLDLSHLGDFALKLLGFNVRITELSSVFNKSVELTGNRYG